MLKKKNQDTFYQFSVPVCVAKLCQVMSLKERVLQSYDCIK